MSGESEFSTIEETAKERRLSAIMFTDIVGYTSLTQRNENLALKILEEHRTILRPIIQRFSGREIKTMGDAFLIEFASTLEAVRCAVEMQQSLRSRNFSAKGAGVQIQIRIGIHLGDVVHSDGDVYGDAVNVASRIEPLAEPGGICFSEEVFSQVRNKIGYEILSLGRKELKNVDASLNVYSLTVPWGGSNENVSPGTNLVVLDKFRIAILPLANLSGDPSDEYFADGMTEELISSICTISGLKVISRTSAMKYKGTRKSIPEIARELNVGSILEGSVRKSQNKVRIAVQFIDGNTDEHLWSQRYDRGLEDIFSIQTEIAESAAEALKVKLLSVERRLIEKKYTESPEAHTLFLKGRAHCHNQTEEEVRKAVECFELALEKDPKFALAYVGLANAYITLCDIGCIDSKEAFAKANSLVLKALDLDDLIPEAHATLAALRQDYHFDWEGAERGFRRAIELNPNWADVCHSYAIHLGLRGRFEQAITEIRRAEELDPFEISIHDCAAETFRVSYHYEQAIEECMRMLELDPNFVPAYVKLGKTYLMRSMFKEGVENMERAAELAPKSVMARSFLAYAYGIVGRREEAKSIIQELEDTAKQSYVSPFHLAIAYAGLDEREAAIQNLLRAYAERSGGLLKIKIDPTFDALRSDPRFQDLVKKIGLS